MAVNVGGTIDLTELDKMLAQLGKEVSDLRPVWFRIDRDVTEGTREQFNTRGAHWGTPWAPISGATIRTRIAKRMLTRRARRIAGRAAGRDTPLRDTGGLFASFTKPGAPGSIRVMDALEYQRGSNYTVNGFPVALAMHRGFKSRMAPVFDQLGDVFFVRRKSPKQVPARQVIPENLPAPVLKQWEGYVKQYIEHGTLK
jgi:hypothetical protein